MISIKQAKKDAMKEMMDEKEESNNNNDLNDKLFRSYTNKSEVKSLRKEEKMLNYSEYPKSQMSENKDNFVIFLSKISKLILIANRMMLPIREAFIKIDKYSSFSYQIEQHLKIIPQKLKKIAFTQIYNRTVLYNNKRYLDIFRTAFSVLEFKRKKYVVQSFTRIKITSIMNAKKSASPIELQMKDEITSFIEERQKYQKSSIENWSKIKTTIQNQLPTTKSTIAMPTQQIIRNKQKRSMILNKQF